MVLFVLFEGLFLELVVDGGGFLELVLEFEGLLVRLVDLGGVVKVLGFEVLDYEVFVGDQFLELEDL